MCIKDPVIKNTLLHKTTFIVAAVIACSIFVFIRCSDTKKEKKEDEIAGSAPVYIGSESCIGCHKDIYASHIRTAHFNTSSPASGDKIAGSFDEGKNEYRFSSRTMVKCEKAGEKYYQAAYVDGAEVMRQEFDIVFGDGKKAQSFAAWSKNKLVQLPLSYFTATGQWINSPGYPDKVVFNRVITSRCLECHSTYAEVTSQEGMLENFNRSNMILGIDCEKCHGAASNHVSYHTQHPADTTGKFIISTKGFSRQQTLDMCALCHSGIMVNKQPAFSFTPGNKLTDHYADDIVAADAGDVDVHGNQYGLLTRSQCFLQSDLTCNSCHDSHKKETGDVLLFSERCMSCHNSDHKKLPGLTATLLQQNCIDCHMPEKASKAIVFHDLTTGEKTAATMRTHYITIYPEQTEKIISYLKRIKK